MYRALHEDLSLDDALDLREIDEVGQSWHAAATKNAKAQAAAERAKGRR